MTQSPVFGVYRNREEGEKATRELRSENFTDVAISSLSEGQTKLLPSNPLENRTAITNTYMGVTAGILIGAAIGLAAGFAFGIIGALSGATLGGAVGAVLGLVLADREKRRYRHYVHSGGVLVTVRSGDPERASEILYKTGAAEVSQTTPGGSPEFGS